METFSTRSVVSVSVMMMPFGETVNVTFRNFLALALACGYGNTYTRSNLVTGIDRASVSLLHKYKMTLLLIKQQEPSNATAAAEQNEAACMSCPRNVGNL